jgi:phospholipid/cholesterol/gamma-HCH transport system substrate-binding protein
MNPDAGLQLRVGLVLVLAAALLAWLVLQVTSGRGFLSDEVRYSTLFTTIGGLSEGAEVRYEGVTVGEVSSIEFADDPNENRIVIEFSVKRSLRSRIDRHVVVELRTNGPLGDRLLELRRPDRPVEEPVPEGSVLPSKAPFEFAPFVEEGEDLFADVRSISQSLKVITARLVAGEGLFGRLLKDKDFGDKTLTDLEVTIERLRGIVESAAEGRNLLGTLVADEPLGEEVASSLRSSSRNLALLTTRLEAGEGVLGQAMRDDSRLSSALEDFGAAAQNLRRFSERLEATDGLASRLLTDGEYGERVAGEIEAILGELRVLLQTLNSEQGSLGRLVNDPAVHDSLERILHGVEESWFITYVLKRADKRGFRQEVDRILRESEDPEGELVELVERVLDVDRQGEAAEAAAVEASPEGVEEEAP